MPWPVTHILTAENYYDSFFSHLNHEKFIIGTCFPDIRYPARLSRKNTHFKNLSLPEIQSKPAFQAGLFFHSYVDEMWNGFVLQKNAQIFSEIPADKTMIHTIKVLQDKFLYETGSNWSQVANYFTSIYPEEKDFGAGEKMVKQWHQMLAYYLSKPPNFNDLQMLNVSLAPDMVDKIGEYYQEYKDHQHLKSILLDFHEQASRLYQEIETV